MMPQIVDLAVQIVRFVDDYQPGIAACQFVDADGRRHTLIDKAPIFSAETLDADSRYPRPGAARSVLKRRRDACGRELASISTADPYSIESSEGLSEFVVLQTPDLGTSGRCCMITGNRRQLGRVRTGSHSGLFRR